MPKKILIIDDDPNIVKYIGALMTDNGYEIIEAYDGTEAEQILKETRPDLITLDLEMPKKWGPRFYRNMTKTKGYEEIPVIVVSGLAGSKHSINRAVASFDKPFDPEALLQTVKDTIGEP